MKLFLNWLLLAVLPIAAIADDQAPTVEPLTSVQVREAKMQWQQQDQANKVRLMNRVTRAKANSAALRAAPGAPLKRPYYGDNAGNPMGHHH